MYICILNTDNYNCIYYIIIIRRYVKIIVELNEKTVEHNIKHTRTPHRYRIVYETYMKKYLY